MKKVIGIILIVIIIMQASLSIATTITELENQESDLQKQIDEENKKLEEIEEQKSEALKEVEKLITQIAAYEIEINDLQDQIDALQKEIDSAEANIEKKEQEYKETKELLDSRLLAICESGEITYLDILLSSKDIIDFIGKYTLVSELVESDTELLETIEKQKKEIEEEKLKLENNKKEIDSVQATKEAKYNELKAAKAQKESYVSKLTEEEKEAQEAKEQFEKDKQQIQSELKKLAEQSQQTVTNIASTPSSSGYIFPISGLSKANISNKTYPSYVGHTGVDININVIGKSVVAVKAGTVVISKALSGSIKNYDSNGNYLASYSSYGEYIVIDHHDGTMTLYGHLKAGSRLVSVGEEVKQGQVIGTVGNTGNCLPRPTASSPLNGTHLHFEVRINGSAVNPLPYLP